MIRRCEIDSPLARCSGSGRNAFDGDALGREHRKPPMRSEGKGINLEIVVGRADTGDGAETIRRPAHS
jgi:hypothetical protein